MDTIPHKLCPACSDTKPITDFCKDKHRPDGLAWRCKVCNSLRGKTYRAANPDKDRARHQVYHATHREERLEKSREGYRRNRASVLTRTVAYQKAHPEAQKMYRKRHMTLHRDRILPKVKAASAAWREKNRDKDRAASLRWVRNNPDRARINHQNRRARKANSEGAYTLQEWQALKAKYEYRCLRCGVQEPAIQLTVDHVVPLVRGGTNYITNIQPLCFSCNCSKNDKSDDYRP